MSIFLIVLATIHHCDEHKINAFLRYFGTVVVAFGVNVKCKIAKRRRLMMKKRFSAAKAPKRKTISNTAICVGFDCPVKSSP